MLTRSKNKMDPDDFIVLFDLYKVQPWLENYNQELVELWNLGDTDDEKWLLAELIKRINFVRSSELNRYASQIREKVISSWSFEPQNTYFVAISDNQEADGSQFLIQGLKSTFAPYWKERNFRNTIGAIHGLPNNSNIILIDDFLGTGKTAKRKIDWVLSKNKEAKKYETKLYFVALAAMEFGCELLLTTKLKDFYIPLVLKKGISEYYEGIDLERANLAMTTLEAKLGGKYNNKKIFSFSFGYGRSETLYSTEFGSTPNNVFPIFWWPKLKQGIIRRTIFKRL